MKYLLLIAGLLAGSAMAKDVYVRPHVTKNGNYVPGHYRTAPDSNPYNNYSTHGNYNPYTGESGTVKPYDNQLQAPRYQQPQGRCLKDFNGNVTCY